MKVPNVTGLMYDEAEQRLAQAGFKAERGEQHYANSAPKMTVLEQSPPPGAREGLGGTITLVVSGGQRMAMVPTVTGMTRSEAQARLEKEGFEVGEVGEASSNAPRGTVVGTKPAPGSQVSVPSTISLVLSRGAAATQMPNLMGRDVDAARLVLAQLGLRDVQVVYDPMGVGQQGSIVGQSPVQGATILPGASVQLRVAGDAAGKPKP
jgi:serine/threonine-protein kinase